MAGLPGPDGIYQTGLEFVPLELSFRVQCRGDAEGTDFPRVIESQIAGAPRNLFIERQAIDQLAQLVPRL
jgi:hypothetical protein